MHNAKIPVMISAVVSLVFCAFASVGSFEIRLGLSALADRLDGNISTYLLLDRTGKGDPTARSSAVTSDPGNSRSHSSAGYGENSSVLVIFLHGLGGSETQLKPIALDLSREVSGLKIALANAPYRRLGGGREWFVVDGRELEPQRVNAARQAFDSVINEIITAQGFSSKLDHVVLVGFSQGAIMALDAVESRRWNFGAIVAFSGMIPFIAHTASPVTPTRILLVHGEVDQTIPVSASIAAEKEFRDAGFSVSLRVLPGLGHSTSKDGEQFAIDFVRDYLTDLHGSGNGDQRLR